MAVSIGTLESDFIVDAEPPSESAARPATDRRDEADVRAALAAAARDAMRTRAEGFDD